VINLTTNTILYNSLVAHGGIQEMNLLPVFQIQLNRIRVVFDFMLQAKYTVKTRKITPIRWFGKGINSNARERAIVIHGAEYVSSSFIQNNKRLGRSLGCPSLPMNLSSEIIQTIKDKSCLFSIIRQIVIK
jgi:hypothetical protein